MCLQIIKIDQAVEYRIRVQGLIAETLSDCLGGLSITHQHTEQKACVTVLEGQVADQAALLGVLVAVYDMRMPLLSVECSA